MSYGFRPATRQTHTPAGCGRHFSAQFRDKRMWGLLARDRQAKKKHLPSAL